jgi:hypothetical protein
VRHTGTAKFQLLAAHNRSYHLVLHSGCSLAVARHACATEFGTGDESNPPGDYTSLPRALHALPATDDDLAASPTILWPLYH